MEQKAKELLNQKDYVSLNEAVERLVKDFPKVRSGYFYRGRYKLKTSDVEGAIKDFTIAIKIDPNYEDAYYYRAIAYERLKEFDYAYEDYSNVIQLSPQKSYGYYYRAWLLDSTPRKDEYDIKDRASIAKDYENAIKYANKDNNDKYLAQCYFKMGTCHNWLRNNEEAISSFEKAISFYEKVMASSDNPTEISLNHKTSYRLIAEIKEDLKDYRGALIAAEKATQLGENCDYLIERYKKQLEVFGIVSNSKNFKIVEPSKNEIDKIITDIQSSNERREQLYPEKNILEYRNNLIFNECYRRLPEHEIRRKSNSASEIFRHSAQLTYYFIFEGGKESNIDKLKNQLLVRIENDNFFWNEGLYIEFILREKTEYLLVVSKFFKSDEVFYGLEGCADYREKIIGFLQDSIENKPFNQRLEKNIQDYFNFEVKAES